MRRCTNVTDSLAKRLASPLLRAWWYYAVIVALLLPNNIPNHFESMDQANWGPFALTFTPPALFVLTLTQGTNLTLFLFQGH
jgi:hypothetical protein